MGIFQRIAAIFKSNINDMIDKAEDPEKMLEQSIRDMKVSYAKSKQEVAKAIADKKRLEIQFKKNDAESKKWEQKAMLAVKAGNDKLAREALKRKKDTENIAKEFEVQFKDQEAITDKLKAALGGLERKIDEASRKKNLLIARQKRAVAQKRINKVMNDMTDGGAFNSFQRLEDKVNNIEAEAEAQSELTSDNLDDQFNQLEAGSGVEDELMLLKAKFSDDE